MPLNQEIGGIEGAFHQSLLIYAKTENSSAIEALIKAASELITPEILERTISIVLTEPNDGHPRIFNMLVERYSVRLMAKLVKRPFLADEFCKRALLTLDTKIIDNYIKFFAPSSEIIAAVVVRIAEENPLRLNQLITD